MGSSFSLQWIQIQKTVMASNCWNLALLPGQQLLCNKMKHKMRKHTFWHMLPRKVKNKLWVHSLINVFVVRMEKLFILGYPRYTQWIFWSDCDSHRLIWIFTGAYILRYFFWRCSPNDHYENAPIKIHWKFYKPKNENFQIKNSDIFHISAQNIDCE